MRAVVVVEREEREMGRENGAKTPHAVCMPFPAQGHINAMLRLARLLHSRGFHITFIHSEFNRNRILASGGPSSLRGSPGFRFESIPDGLPPSDPATSQDLPSLMLAVRDNLAAPFRQLLRRLNEPSSGAPPVTCVVSDTVASFTLDVAAELGIPDVSFCSISACAFMGCIQYKELEARGLVPLKSEEDLVNGYLDAPLDWIPGMKNIRLKDIPSLIRTTDPDDIKFTFVRDEFQAANRATAIIINTFEELEHEVLEAMSLILPPIYTVGPLNLLQHQTLDDSLDAIGPNSLLEEDASCLKWLQGRAVGSVIYVNFGSLALMTDVQFTEFAWELANCGHDFLWVVRPDGVAGGGGAVLPEGFLDGTGGRGLVTTWCPQEEVLMHPSVGGFLTHCGWNSMMETISAGVPVLCWPYFGDQQTNCRYACAEWGVGMEIEGNVRREEVEGMIMELMGGERGRKMKSEALKWRECAIEATKPGGKSSINLDRMINEVLL